MTVCFVWRPMNDASGSDDDMSPPITGLEYGQ